MILRGSVSLFLVVSALCGLAPGGPAQVQRSALGPLAAGLAASPGAGASDETWLSEIVLVELRRFAGTGEYAVFSKRLEAAMLARLCCGRLEKLDALNDMVYARRACRFLPVAETVGGKKLVNWLLDHREVSRRLFRALNDARNPQPSLRKLQELVAADEKTVLAYPGLAVAFATTLPLKHHRDRLEPASMLDSFRWYTNPKVPFRYDVKTMPYELSRYLADTRLSIAERRWAVAQHLRKRDPAKTYFDVRYDMDYYRRGVAKKIASAPYTLVNLRRLGGVCIDQAYYASEVCKALGIPACVVSGRSAGGIGHAWLACLKVPRGARQAVWDSRTGRYRCQQYYLGRVRDPAGGGIILDSELMLLGSAAQLPLPRREEADAAAALARLVQTLGSQAGGADLKSLERLAELYNQHAASQQRKTKAVTGWLAAERKTDLALVEDLIALSVERNLAHRPPWELLIELRKAKQLPVDHLDRFFDILVTRTAKVYPDYSCLMVMRIVPTIAEPDRREAVYRKALGVYRRPDLQGRILIALGEDYSSQDKQDKALEAYGQAASRCLHVAEIVLQATQKAEAVLVAADRRDLAVGMYQQLFAQAKKSRASSVFRSQTAYYQIGKRLADLLADAGKSELADRILAEIRR